MKKEPPFKRLYANTTENKDTGCMEWQGQVGSSGYGQIKAFGKMVSCHRLSFELYNGAIPFNLEVMHSCDNRICVNPDHLSLGTHKENMNDMADKGRRVQGKPNPRKGVNQSQSRQVIVLGKPYGSINEAEKALGKGSGTVSYWIKSKPEKAKFITKKEYWRLTQCT